MYGDTTTDEYDVNLEQEATLSLSQVCVNPSVIREGGVETSKGPYFTTRCDTDSSFNSQFKEMDLLVT